jgi:hypothetical protein
VFNGKDQQGAHYDDDTYLNIVGSIYVGLLDTSDDISHIHVHTKSSFASPDEWSKHVASCNRSAGASVAKKKTTKATSSIVS